MILRILRARTGKDDLDQVLAAVRADIDDWSGIEAGLVSALPAYRAADGDLDFLLVSTWSDAEAVIARGGEVTQPRGRLGASGKLRDAHAGHFELVISATHPEPRIGEVVRLSSIPLIPRRSSAYYEYVRQLWQELVRDAGLFALHVGRRFESDAEQAVVVSVWESTAVLDAATSGGLVGGAAMSSFYASEPTIEHFTAVALEEPPASE